MRPAPRIRLSSPAAAAVLLPALALALAAGQPARVPAVSRGEAAAFWLYLDHQAARSAAPAPLGGAALARRRAHGIPIFADDHPIAPALLARIRATGAAVRVESRWLRAVSVAATPRQLRALRRLSFIRRIEPVRRLAAAAGPVPTVGAAYAAARGRGFANPCGTDVDSLCYGPNYRALVALGIPLVHDLGLSGAGVRIAILDTGFERMHVALRGRIIRAQYDFIHGDSVVANDPADPPGSIQEQHGTQVWSLLGGYFPGLIVGPAYNATFLLARVDVEPGDTKADEDRWVAGAEWADAQGADIISSSVYFRSDYTDRPEIPFQELNGHVTAVSVAAGKAASRGILVVQAIGDARRADGSLAAPADADSVLSVGAVNLAGAPVDLGGLASSARGPTADGRTKPEVVAVGENLWGANAANLVGVDPVSGTSFSTALMAGAAALFMEAWPDLTAIAAWRALILAGSNADAPNDSVGWGVPDVAAAIMMPEDLTAVSVTPRDLAGNPASLAPVFHWEAPLIYSGARPLRFILELARDRQFQNVVVTDTVLDALSVPLDRPLGPGQMLWWRVTAESPHGIRRRSDVGGPFTTPHWVKLETLTGEQPAHISDSRPTLSWTPLPAPAPVGPLTFDVDVLDNVTGLVLQAVARNITASTVRVREILPPNRPGYRWRVIARTQQGQADTITSGPNAFVIDSPDAPPATILYQNFPNPFPNLALGALSTRVWFDLEARSRVELSVHDLRGRLIRTLIPAQPFPACPVRTLDPGLYGRPGSPYDDDPCILTRWDGRDQRGERVPRGVYVLRLLVDGKPYYRRMLYLPD